MAAREPGGASRDWRERGPVSAGMHKLLPESNNERHRQFPGLACNRNECQRMLPLAAEKTR
jgi:hypothetical protein